MTNTFTGTGVALATPFNRDKSIDFNALDRVVNHVIDGGVEYLVALGTTGESVTLSAKEKEEVVAAVIKCSGKRLPIVIGIGGNNTSSLVEQIKNTDFSEISGLLTVAPYYNRPSQNGMFEHFSAIAEVSPVPVILYNVPGRTASNISAETTLKLARAYKNIVAVKEASGNFQQVMQIIKNKPDDFAVLSGDDALTLPMIHLGGSGVISVVANSHPKEFSDMVRAALKRDCKLANELHYKLLDYIGALFEEGSPTGLKAAMEILDLCSDQVRLPLVSASKELKEKLSKLIKEI